MLKFTWRFTMKCIRNAKTNKVSRVRDEAARLYVAAGTHHYIPRQQWKEAGRP